MSGIGAGVRGGGGAVEGGGGGEGGCGSSCSMFSSNSASSSSWLISILLRHTVVCRAAKKVTRNTGVLFMSTKISPISTSHILKTTELISTKFTHVMLYIYLTLHTKFNTDCAKDS